MSGPAFQLVAMLMLAAVFAGYALKTFLPRWRCEKLGHDWEGTETGMRCRRCKHAMNVGDEL